MTIKYRLDLLKKDKRLVFIIANSVFTVFNFRFELIRELKAKGFEVLVVCPNDCELSEKDYLKKNLRALDVQHIELNFSRSGFSPIEGISVLFRLHRIIKAAQPDLILNYTLKPVIFSSIAARLCKISNVYSNITGLGYTFTARSLKAFILRKIVIWTLRVSLRFNKKVFFQNPDDFMLFCKLRLISENQGVLIAGSGVDTKHFKRSGEVTPKPSFLFVGRLLRDKGIYEFVNAAEELLKQFPQVKIGVAGSHDLNPQSLTSQELERFSNIPGLTFYGQVTGIKNVLERYQVLVLPSYREGTPRAVLEAMSMSMPIVTTKAPGCRETVVERSNGLLVPVGDSERLYEAMRELVLNPPLVFSMARKSREYAVEKYDVIKVNAKIINNLDI